VFEDESLEYTAAMLAFVAASQPTVSATQAAPTDDAEGRSLKRQKQALRQEEAHLRAERRTLRQQRSQEDQAWQTLRSEHKEQPAVPADQDEAWRALRQQRRQTLTQRQQEDERWRQSRRSLRERWSQLPIVSAWIAILVITDNCSRQCLGLPLLLADPRVTSELIVEALRALLPPELLFLITDRGVHFTAQAFQELMRQEEFIHVLIARHRPQSNGIAERFVRTLKEWLMDKSWQDDRELALLLTQFLDEYNDRPHQGLAIPGLSPNEFANRIWLM
jgi:transposase InsO family protein